jgi:hypothetical protein
MSMVIVLEVIVAIVVLAVAVRFAVRDTRQRRDVSPEQRFQSEDTGGTQPHAGKQVAEHPSEVADQRESEEVAAVSASSTAGESGTETH